MSEAYGVSLVWYWVLWDLWGLSVGLIVVSGACGVSLWARVGIPGASGVSL